jgi:hypothetical protein
MATTTELLQRRLNFMISKMEALAALAHNLALLSFSHPLARYYPIATLLVLLCSAWRNLS